MFARARRILKYIKLHQEPGSKSKFKQIKEMIYLAVKYRFSPLEYEAYNFFHTDKDLKEMLRYLSNHEVTVKLRPPLVKDKKMAMLLNNKLIFGRYFKSFGLPLPELYAYLDEDSGFTAGTTPIENVTDFGNWLKESGKKQFVIKPVKGMQGIGIIVIADVHINGEQITLLEVSGKTWQVETFYKAMTSSRQNGYIIEERVAQDSNLLVINETSLNTCRILTVKFPDGSIYIPFAVMKFGRKGSPVDNWVRGGIAAGVDVSSGILTKGYFFPLFGGGCSSVHPDSQLPIEGLKLPFWDLVIKLALKAATLTPDIRSIGWDIAFSQTGPILIEGNVNWGPMFMQATNGGILTPDFEEKMKQYNLSFR